MKDKHITDILDNTALADFTEDDLQTISVHVKTCAACHRAYVAAEASALLMKARASEAAANSAALNPFFQTRVLAAWREQQMMNSVPAFRRLWNASGALVASMAATTVALAVLTFVAPASETATQQTAALVPNSAESFVLDQDQNDNQLTNDQVISAIYVDEDEGK